MNVRPGPATLGAMALTSALLGCSSDRATALHSPSAGGQPADVPDGAAGNASRDGAPDADPLDPRPGQGDLGDVPVLDVEAGEPCAAPAGGTIGTVTRAEEAGTTFVRAGIVGTRRFAFGSESGVLMTFAPDGSAPSPILLGAAAVAAGAGSLAAVLLGGQTLDVAWFNEGGDATGSLTRLHEGPIDAPSIAAGPAGVVVAWRANGVVRGAVIAEGNVAGSFEMSSTSGGEGYCQTASTADASGFGIVYTRRLDDETTKSTWARVGPDGTLQLAKTLLVAEGEHTLVDLQRTSTGYLVLVGEGRPTIATVLVQLDEFGNVVPPLRRLLGTGLPFAAAAGSSGFAVTTVLEDGRAGLRVFSDALEPEGGWLCVDDSTPDSSFYAQAGVARDGEGWGIIARMTDLSASYRRTDRTGLGAP